MRVGTWTSSGVVDTIPPETSSNDFGGFWNYLGDSNSNFVVAKIIFF